MFNWAVTERIVPSSPFHVGGVPVVRMARETARSRRLQGDEGERLLAACGAHLKDLVIAALETGCRLGELLSLQWSQVRLQEPAELLLVGSKTKTRRARRVPVSSLLGAVLGARRRDPAGDLLPPDAYVFGDAIGRRRGSIKTAWGLALRRAGIVGLHFHDLRREAGSRWLDHGVSLGSVQRWLGHSNIAQTSTYLGASIGSDERDMRAFEERLGRVAPVAHGGIFSGSNRAQPTESGARRL